MSGLKPLARIHRPPRSAMQSGRANTHEWVLEYAPSEGVRLDPLTGWPGSGDTRNQLSLRFPTREAAVAYAQTRGISFEVETPPAPKPIQPKVYADNFRTNRGENWTH
ncbi:ETC complex I subunit [Roseococcus pinisoli]|uniref:ETC complex I subunit n=1 Tax=Roseococcus pinisoli TaxID=2835040 RepID=A0ABS5QGS1_9PROT|nr:ETC complex I subunit [Roseococcus pinisoli]MBS7812531.1 ETC complex I subunit [Roseococcus pinisoli]